MTDYSQMDEATLNEKVYKTSHDVRMHNNNMLYVGILNMLYVGILNMLYVGILNMLCM